MQIRSLIVNKLLCKKIVLFIGLFSIIGIFFCNFQKKTHCYNHLGISSQDRYDLELFFKDLFLNKNFGYVLIGTKPVAIASYFCNPPFLSCLFSQKLKTLNIEHSWHLFEKYMPVDQWENFVLIKEDTSLDNHKICDLIMINKAMFLLTVKQHLDLFKRALGNWVTPEGLFNKIAANKTSFFEILQKDDCLLGILLGYGRANAIAFKRWLVLSYRLDPIFRECSSPFTLHITKPSTSFHSITDEYQDLNQRLSFSDFYFPLSPITPPAFRVLRNDQEFKQLRNEYHLAHRRLLDIYCKSDFITEVLKLLEATAEEDKI